MLCYCEEPAFVFTKIEKKGEYFIKSKIYKCERLKNESNKKQPCIFYNVFKINTFEYPKFIEIDKSEKTVIVENNYEKINYYIKLCEDFGLNENYMANIIHLLSLLNYQYIQGEKLSELKKRLTQSPDKKIVSKINKSKLILDIPSYLKTINTTKKRINKKNEKNEYKIIDLNEESSENESETSQETFELDINDNFSDEEYDDDQSNDGYFTD